MPAPRFTSAAGVYVDGAEGDAADGKIAITDLPKGTYGVWAEKAMDATLTYVRTGLHHVDVDYGPRVTNVVGSATLAGGRLAARAAFTLDKRCSVKVSVFNRDGKLLAKMAAEGLTAGRHALVWRGRPTFTVTSLVSFVVESDRRLGSRDNEVGPGPRGPLSGARVVARSARNVL